MKNLIITESQFERLLSKFDRLITQQKNNVKPQEFNNSRLKLSDSSNPINTVRITTK